MKIIVDITQLTARPITGIGKVLENLIFEFKKRKDIELIYFALTARGFLPELKKLYPNLKAPKIPARFSVKAMKIAQSLSLPIDIFTGPADAVISVGSLCLPLRSGITVATIHDVFPLSNPEWNSKANIELFTSYLKSAEKHADLVITDSVASKKEILKYTNILRSKLVVAYPGLSQVFKSKPSVSVQKKVRRKYNLPDSFLLFVGSQTKRKNLKGLIEAYSSLSQKTKKETKLVLVGSEEKGKKNLRPRFVLETGFIPDKDLPVVYGLASGLVYPSFKEGFGLPIIEAFASNTPVLTSNTSSMKEIARDVALLVDPYSVEDITKGLQKLLTLSEKNKAKLIIAGKQRLKLFSFKNMADKIITEIKQKQNN